MSTNLRAAAFLAEQQRLDRRRLASGGKVQCLPPNRACGNRCIPPNWSCRLRGEGNDPHLRAAGRGTDIVSGFANLQRGFTSIGKGVAKLNFSEVETGRRALARGTAKLHPGDLKKKEEAKKAVYNTAMWVLTPVVLGITAALGHQGLKSFRIYREGVGRDIDDTFRQVTDRLARNTPFGVGEGIRAREAAGLRGLQSVSSSQRGIAETLRSRTTTGTRTLQVATARRSTGAGAGQHAIQDALDSVNKTPGVTSSYLGVEEWYPRSLTAFWSVKRPKSLQNIANVGEGSLYSIDSTNTLLARSLGLRDSNNQPLNLRGVDLEQESSQVRNLIASRIKAERENIAVGMRQAGLDPKDATSVQQYLQRNQSAWQTGNATVDEEISRTIENMMSGKTAESTIAAEMYRRTVNKFDTYYDDIRDLITNPPGIGAGQTRRRQLYQDAVRGHAQYLARTIDFGFDVNGPGMTALLKKAYHKRRVQQANAKTSRDLSLTSGELANVASELGIDIRTRQAPELEALINRRLQELVPLPDNPKAKPRITVSRVQAPAEEARARAAKTAAPPEPGASGQPSTPEPAAPRPARRRRVSEQQIIQRLIKAGYSEEAARIKAAQYIAEREARAAAQQAAPERGDSLDTWSTRDDAHLDTWIHLDKRCGKSGIPENRKCRKTTPAQSEKSRARERGKAPGLTCNPPNKQCGEKCIPPTATCDKTRPGGSKGIGGVISTAGKVALTAGVVAGGVLAYKNRKPIGKAYRFGKAAINAERAAYNQIKQRKLSQLNSYGGKKYSPRAASRAARQEYIANRRESIRAATPWVADTLVKKLSTQEVYEGLNKLPKQLQQPARNLVGDAKRVAIGAGLRAEGLEVVSVTNKHNFATYRAKDGTIASVGSVGDSLIVYHSQVKGEIRGVTQYGMAFRVDNKYDQRKGLAPEQADSIKKATRAMFDEQVNQLPDNAFIFNNPDKDDGLGRKREAAYKRLGFRRLPGSDNMWAIKDQGKFRKLTESELEVLAKLLNERGDSTETPDIKLDKTLA
jgi:hypothetical protein